MENIKVIRARLLLLFYRTGILHAVSDNGRKYKENKLIQSDTIPMFALNSKIIVKYIFFI